MTCVLLNKIESAEAMNRWYTVTVQATLLDPVAVICAYGSRKNTWQRVRVLPATSSAEAETLAETIARQKLRRGYKVVSNV